MDSLDFLAKAAKAKRRPYYLLVGDEPFLKRRVLDVLTGLILEGGDPAMGLSVFSGDKAEFRAVRAEVQTLPFLATRRMVLVEQADAFVTRHRVELEAYLAEPSKAGTLVLDLKSLPANTKLAKAVAVGCRIDCKAPASYKLADWCAKWAESAVGKRLPKSAAEVLVDLVGPHMGQLDQELHKLAVYVGGRNAIEASDVDELVGRSRDADLWKIMTAVGDNDPAAALRILSEVFRQGNDPHQIFAGLRKQVRELATAGHLVGQGVPLEQALDRAGVPSGWKAKRDGVKKQMRHLGLRRLSVLFDWLLQAELDLKGSSPLPPRLILERLVVQLARPRAA